MPKAKKKTKAKRERGRPEKINREIIEKIKNAIMAGAYIETAAAFAGISKDTFYQWLKKGAAANTGIYADFSDAIKKAAAEAELRDVMVINRAAANSWQAAAWKLERKYPSRRGVRARLDLAGDDKPITIQYHQID